MAATCFGTFLQGVEQFDAAAFGLSGPEALAMDPQHRLLLASAAQLLAATGAPSLQGSSGRAVHQRVVEDTGVFVGISWTEYHTLSKACGQPVGANTAQGAVLSVACGR
jgi:acyl transferase domain-containing protein